ncbi:MAG: glycosyltransferase family 4 protein, partial [Patescibacteria group bacterium]
MENISSEKAIIAYLTTFPPRECGIATFTRDLTEHFDKMYSGREATVILAMKTDEHQRLSYSAKVIKEVLQNKVEDYEDAAEMLNAMPDVALVAIEHEYGIYGEGYGKNLLCFLETIKKPVSVTCHTVLPNPPEEMKSVMKQIIDRANIVIVMTHASKNILREVYGAPEDKVKVIPHGIHPAPYTDGRLAKKNLGFANKKIISTFGFLSRGKGIEYGIKAMPEIVKKFPDCLYLVIGETHPVVKKKDGEEYRESLGRLAKDLGVEKNVIFFDKFLETAELLQFLEATDIYLSLSQNTDQAVSGTLSYALGAGRPVIATPFSQAKEIITPDVGALVEVGESDGIAREVSNLFADEPRRIALGKNAYFHTRIMTWPNVALSYMREFAMLAPVLAKRERVLPALKLTHLSHLTDDFGAFQFAILDKPDPAWGYTLDDNARALAAMAWCANQGRDKKISARLAPVYLSFIKKSLSPSGKFHNYFTGGRVPHDVRNESENLEDARARTLWALAEAAKSNLSWLSRRKAKILFKKNFKFLAGVSSPRASAFVIKACYTWIQNRND